MEVQNVSQFLGYENKRDITNQKPGVLIVGSKNVVSTDGDTIAIREGYVELGAENNALTPVKSSFEWLKLRIGQIALRSFDDTLQFFWSTEIGGDGEWYDVYDNLSNPQLSFTTFYNAAEEDDQLLFVQGNNNIYTWSGGIATFASAAATTITLQGTQTWVEKGFLTVGTTQFILNGITYTYTGGETTTTLTGVTPDPTLGGHAPGDLIVQAIQTIANQPASSAPFTNDIIRIFRNQAIIGSYNDRTLYISADGDLSDYSPSSPRLPGEGISLTLDAAPVDIVVPNDGRDTENFYITAGKDFWFQATFVLSSDLQNETVTIAPLKSDSGQAAHNQGAVGFIKNFIAFVSVEPTFDFLGRIQDVDSAQSTNISDRIKKDFDAYNFTDCHVRYFKNNVYIALPAESLLLCYNLSKEFWEAPWILPAGRIAVIDGNLCIHSNATPSTYQLFNGYNDNGNPIDAVARFSYQNWGERMKYKNYIMATAEGYMTANTTLNVTVLQDFEGYTGEPTFTVSGTEGSIFALNSIGSALGKYALGKKKLAGEATPITKKKFRKYKKNVKQNFFEAAWQFSSNDVDQIWEIISFGGDVTISSDYPIKNIK